MEDKFEGLVDIRRNLHMYLELSFEEVKTPAMVAEFLKDSSLKVKTG